MADLMQQVRELLPCPFCGNTVQDDEGCFQSAGFRPHSTAVWSVRCGNPSCNADVSGTSADDAVDAWNRRPALRAAPEWQPIETAPEGKLIVVAWLDDEGGERQEFDYIEDGMWIHHADLVEHAQMVAPPGSKMPKEQPPYQWWMDLPVLPAARPQGVEDA